jgi:uncharacterized protein (DUF1330 family)
MPKGYVILTEAIKDPEGMKAYGQAAGAAMGGVNILAVDTAPKVVEGSWHGDQTVVLEFESGGRGPGVVRVGGLSEGSETAPSRRRL